MSIEQNSIQAEFFRYMELPGFLDEVDGDWFNRMKSAFLAHGHLTVRQIGVLEDICWRYGVKGFDGYELFWGK